MKIGIIGGGQLGRMLALSGKQMGFEFGFLAEDNPTINGLGRVFNDIKEFDNFADVITYESENTDLKLVNSFSTKVYPPISALEITQNRYFEKKLFNKLDIPCADFQIIKNCAEIDKININYPVLAKTNVNGYDGKGQYILKSNQDINTIDKNLIESEFILEQFVDFDYEVSIIGCYGKNQAKYYPLIKNSHKSGILQSSEVIDNKLFAKAKEYLDKVAKYFDYIGILTIEFFVVKDKLVANEIAPRVHNSGHWSIEGAQTSQFENHLRAILNLELGNTKILYQNIKMQNIIGNSPDIKNILAANSKVHLYNKSPRPGRKVGHINILE